jgi:hypothetical protein
MKSCFSYLQAGFFAVLVVFTSLCQAQTSRKSDIIMLRDSTKLEVIIQEVNESTVKYKKITDTGGPVFSVSKSAIASILYGNGETEHFTAQSQVYFDEAPVPPVTSSTPYTGKALPFYNLPIRTVQEWDSNQLRTNYKFYLKKAETFRKMGAVGVLGGVALVGVGIGIMSSYSHSSTYHSLENFIGGYLVFLAGLGAGVPLTIIGFVKKKSYTKKALIVKDELRRRNEPFALKFAPAYNAFTQSAGLSVKMSF